MDLLPGPILPENQITPTPAARDELRQEIIDRSLQEGQEVIDPEKVFEVLYTMVIEDKERDPAVVYQIKRMTAAQASYLHDKGLMGDDEFEEFENAGIVPRHDVDEARGILDGSMAVPAFWDVALEDNEYVNNFTLDQLFEPEASEDAEEAGVTPDNSVEESIGGIVTGETVETQAESGVAPEQSIGSVASSQLESIDENEISDVVGYPEAVTEQTAQAKSDEVAAAENEAGPSDNPHGTIEETNLDRARQLVDEAYAELGMDKDLSESEEDGPVQSGEEDKDSGSAESRKSAENADDPEADDTYADQEYMSAGVAAAEDFANKASGEPRPVVVPLQVKTA